MPKIFISYRRDDTGGEDSNQMIWRIRDRLRQEFGDNEIFFDKDNIVSGADWEKVLTENVQNASIILPIIGSKWVEILKQKSQDPEDYVRFEIELGLRLKKSFFPCLVDGAEQPSPDDYPTETMRRLNSSQFAKIRGGNDFDNDIKPLIKAIRKKLRELWLAKVVISLIALIAIISVVFIGTNIFENREPIPDVSPTVALVSAISTENDTATNTLSPSYTATNPSTHTLSPSYTATENSPTQTTSPTDTPTNTPTSTNTPDSLSIHIEVHVSDKALTLVYNHPDGAEPVSLSEIRIVNNTHSQEIRLGDVFGAGVVENVASSRCLQFHLGEVEFNISNCDDPSTFYDEGYPKTSAFWGQSMGGAFVKAQTILLYWNNTQLGDVCNTDVICEYDIWH